MSKNKNYTAEDVISLCREYMNEKSIQFIEKALEYATFAHKDQVRKSGEAYIVHPIQVAGILAELRLDPDTIATGFLHDVVEDTGFTIEDIEYVFGTKISRVSRYVYILMVLIGAFGSLGIIVSFLDISLASLVIINMFGVLTMTGVAVEESDRFFEFLKNEK